MSALAAPERVLALACEGQSLVGILHPAAGTVGVVVVVGGPQYRAGSHRQFVRLARCLAQDGHPVLRFDARGMGDSSGTPPGFEQIGADIAAAVDGLVASQPQVTRVVLWGLCDAASAALMYAQQRTDSRIAGLCLLNPWVRSVQGLAKVRVRHYYLQRLRQRDFWIKLLRGGVAARAGADLIRNVGQATRAGAGPAKDFRQRMLAGWQAFGGPLLLILSDNDLTAREFVQLAHDDPAWQQAVAGPNVQRIDVQDADHTFSTPEAGERMRALTLDWLNQLSCARHQTGARQPQALMKA